MKRVITFGTFDLFHVGHYNILKRSAALGSYLVVGISTDDLNVAKKNTAPICSYNERVEVVSSLRFVDHVFTEESLELKAEYINKYRADILVMGDDWQGKFDFLKPLCEVVYLPRTEGISSTCIRNTLR